MIVVAVASALLAACGATESATTESTRAPASPSTTTTSSATTTTALPPITARAPTTTTLAPTTTTRRDRTLERGDRSAGVRRVQARLMELRYWVGPVDGVFGRLTQQAFFAFQKIQGLAIDGVVGPATRARLSDPIAAGTRSSSAVVWEVDKSRQVALLVSNGDPVWIWNTSTGTERPYTHYGHRRVADTPAGHHRIYREVNGWDSGPLGDLYRPKYFHTDGIAIHGYPSVPASPASHGCVRVSIAAINFIWANDLAPVGREVWVYGTTPR